MEAERAAVAKFWILVLSCFLALQSLTARSAGCCLLCAFQIRKTLRGSAGVLQSSGSLRTLLFLSCRLLLAVPCSARWVRYLPSYTLLFPARLCEFFFGS